MRPPTTTTSRKYYPIAWNDALNALNWQTQRREIVPVWARAGPFINCYRRQNISFSTNRFQFQRRSILIGSDESPIAFFVSLLANHHYRRTSSTNLYRFLIIDNLCQIGKRQNGNNKIGSIVSSVSRRGTFPAWIVIDIPPPCEGVRFIWKENCKISSFPPAHALMSHLLQAFSNLLPRWIGHPISLHGRSTSARYGPS